MRRCAAPPPGPGRCRVDPTGDVYKRQATKTSRLATALTTRDRTLRRPKARKAGWTDLDVRAVDTIRVLAADAVQRLSLIHI